MKMPDRFKFLPIGVALSLLSLVGHAGERAHS